MGRIKKSFLGNLYYKVYKCYPSNFIFEILMLIGITVYSILHIGAVLLMTMIGSKIIGERLFTLIFFQKFNKKEMVSDLKEKMNYLIEIGVIETILLCSLTVTVITLVVFTIKSWVFYGELDPALINADLSFNLLLEIWAIGVGLSASIGIMSSLIKLICNTKSTKWN